MPDTTIKRALIAVYDKTGIADFARALVDEFGIEIISTGGTAKHLKEAGIPVTMVEEVTGFPEMLDGRVKTLHPMVHAGILADRSKPEHMRQLAEHGIKPIDMVVVNLYPFEDTIAKPDCTFDEAIEMIDIGGPCMLRAAAKNHRYVLTVEDPNTYDIVLTRMRLWRDENDESGMDDLRYSGAFGVFWATSGYDARIATWLGTDESNDDPFVRVLRLWSSNKLRYGENPHQSAGMYENCEDSERWLLGSADVDMGNTVQMSFNNYVDSNAALDLCRELTRSKLATPGGLEPATPQPDRENCSRGDEEPRTSVRAAHRKPIALIAETSLQEPDPHSACWLLTWTTYGSWLPGDERGFVSRVPRTDGTHAPRNEPETPYDVGSRDLLESAKGRMKGDRVALGSNHAVVLADSFFQSAKTHGVAVISFAIMPDHVHLLCQSQDSDGAKLLQLFKGAASRRLSQSIPLDNAPRWWSEGGSKRYIRKGDDPAAAIEYVCSQKRPLIVRCFDSSRNRNAGSTFGTARTEVRGSSHETNAQTPSGTARTEVRGSSDEVAISSLSKAATDNAAHSAEVANVCCFIKHTNACGVAADADAIEAYRRAYLGDPNAAMGGILAVNFAVDADFADAVMNSLARWGKEAGAGAFFVEVWLAPSFDEAAIEVIRTAKKWGERVRLLAVGDMSSPPAEGELDYKKIAGGMLVQGRDLVGLNEDQWKVVSDRRPTDAEMADLRLAWLTCKHTKSNAITVCKDGMLIGNGAGQMSRVMSCRIATWLAKENGHEAKLAGSVAASDAFFPFRDGPDILADAGVTAIIQPGGSKRDEDTIAACNERGLAMIFTGTRHFKH